MMTYFITAGLDAYLIYTCVDSQIMICYQQSTKRITMNDKKNKVSKKYTKYILKINKRKKNKELHCTSCFFLSSNLSQPFVFSKWSFIYQFNSILSGQMKTFITTVCWQSSFKIFSSSISISKVWTSFFRQNNKLYFRKEPNSIPPTC